MTSTSSPKRPLHSLFFAILFFLALAGGLEGAARSSWAAGHLPRYRSFGNDHYQFEIKWFGLERYVARHGGVDVLILGNSMANTGVDPDVITALYAEQTGRPVGVYNFGVEGLTLHGNLALAALLLEEYQPEVLVFVADVRDLDDANLPNSEARLLSDPWVRYRLGEWTLAGWLFDHSQALQVYLPYRNWVRADFPDTFYNYLYRAVTITESGYEPDTNTITLDEAALNEIRNSAACTQYYPQIEIGAGRLEELRALLALANRHGARLIVAEMPVNPVVYECMTGAVNRADFQQAMTETLAPGGGIFLPAEPGLPVEAHIDMHHLNRQGAAAFSRQLGLALLGLYTPSR
ncbi:MAG: hypothetical protein ABWK53_01400 [Anaerolineales bacterium]